MQVNPEIASVVKPDSFGAKMAFKVRRKIYGKLAENIDLEQLESILDVGVTADSQAAYSNFFECFYPHSDRICALSDQDASALEKLFPGLTFVQGDGCCLPFDDDSFDLVFSSAVIEHVGNYHRQKALIAEALRVSRKYVFITTPNRWHVFEFHTYWPFLHWLPKKLHRMILRCLGLRYLSKEENLNLLSRRTLKRICRELGIKYQIMTVDFLLMPSNLLLLIEKNDR
ncbi:MAG: methyltransferase domain-containing protein [Lentisphaerae bacterium]|nr:methyltransferase domain-containing protein [Lentisphaerota bacterium]